MLSPPWSVPGHGLSNVRSSPGSVSGGWFDGPSEHAVPNQVFVDDALFGGRIQVDRIAQEPQKRVAVNFECCLEHWQMGAVHIEPAEFAAQVPGVILRRGSVMQNTSLV